MLTFKALKLGATLRFLRTFQTNMGYALSMRRQHLICHAKPNDLEKVSDGVILWYRLVQHIQNFRWLPNKPLSSSLWFPMVPCPWSHTIIKYEERSAGSALSAASSSACERRVITSVFPDLAWFVIAISLFV